MSINKSQIKRNKTNIKSRLINNYYKKRIKTLTKNIILLLSDSKKTNELEKLRNKLFSVLDKAKLKNIYNLKHISRKKSNIQKKINNK